MREKLLCMQFLILKDPRHKEKLILLSSVPEISYSSLKPSIRRANSYVHQRSKVVPRLAQTNYN